MSRFRKVSNDDIKKMIQKADSDKNGKISIHGKFSNLSLTKNYQVDKAYFKLLNIRITNYFI